MQTKTAKQFRWRVYDPLVVTSIIGFVTMILLPSSNFWWWIAGMALAVIAAVVVTIRQMHSFSCPDCGQHIPHFVDTAGKSGAPINFYCPCCDVLWETGLSTNDD